MTEQTDDDLRGAARVAYGSDDIEIDDNAIVSRGDDGAFVAAWVWVYYDETEGDGIAACDQCGNTLNDGSDICDQCGGAFGYPV